MPKPAIERFVEKLDFAEGDHWLFTGALNGHGYGQIRDDDGRTVGAHVLMYRLTVGPVPEGKLVLHSMDCVGHRNCVSPAHLYTGSHLDNTLDIVRQGRHQEANKTHCPAGHGYTEENTLVSYPPSKSGPQRTCRECDRARKNRSN